MNTDIPEAETRSLIAWLIIAMIIWAAVAAVTSCTLNKNTDSADDANGGEPIPRAIEVLIK